MNRIENNGRFRGIGEVLAMSWPASLSMLSPTVTRFIDGLMVSRLGPQLGPESLAAQTAAGLLALAPESFAMGTLSVVNTFVSQNLGAARPMQCGQYGWAGLRLASLYCLLILPLLALSGPIFALMPQVPQIRHLELMYFRYMVLAAVFTLPSRALEGFFFGIHRPRVVFTCSLLANAVNLAGNYVLIFGKFGFPRLELQGAAIASVFSWAVQFAMLAGFYLSSRMRRTYGTAAPAAATAQQMREIFTIGWPAGAQFFNDVLSWSVFNRVLVGHFGAVHLAASSAAMRYMPLSFMPAVGIGIATTALVGRYIGEGRKDLARQRTHMALGLAMSYMGACAVVFLLLRYPMVRAFIQSAGPVTDATAADNAEIIRIGAKIMLLAAVFQLFDAIGIVYVGALRGAGDTRWPMAVTVVLSWGLTVGAGLAVMYFLPALESVGPWAAASAYVIVLGLLLTWRFERGPWTKIDLLRRQRPAAAPAVSGPLPAPANPDEEQGQ